MRRAVASGFTLVEVLVALAVLAITLGAGLRAAGALTQSAQRLTDVTLAQWCADNQLVALKISRAFPGFGDSDFACEQLGRRWRGQLHIEATPNANLRRADARVLDAQGVPVIIVSTLLVRE